MNRTEQKAFNWLIDHGANKVNIAFQKKSSPDFITDVGKFEVKTTKGKSLSLTGRQIEMLKDGDVTFLVYVKEADNPLVIKSDQILSMFHIHTQSGITIPVSKPLIDEIRQRKPEWQAVNATLIVDILLRSKLEELKRREN